MLTSLSAGANDCKVWRTVSLDICRGRGALQSRNETMCVCVCLEARVRR